MANYLDHVYTDTKSGNKMVYVKPNLVTHLKAGIMSAADKIKLDDLEEGANNYTLPVATSTTLGGLKISFTDNNANIALKLDANDKGYVSLTKAAIEAALGFTPQNVEPYTLPVATGTALGGVKITYADVLDKVALKLDTTNKGYVLLTKAAIIYALGYTPANTSDSFILSAATGTSLGGLKISYTDNDANVALKLDSNNKGYVSLTADAIISALGYEPLNSATTQECTLDALKVKDSDYDDSIIMGIIMNS